ncbi:MlaE family lipid ABC transporter permease subunit [Paracoccus sp. S-4012]|uniref:ABC transporter permease n=1 Tax=Paracoccus sp. S-4012 TaxID=2665648 RepID=UPI0012AF7241|nr:ABC transporter permease [Paracoccus sp. S-4012]MRX50528.1 MlaE family lipid ABC transporter permease subunit [Paracoccus sp. S-4012]
MAEAGAAQPPERVMLEGSLGIATLAALARNLADLPADRPLILDLTAASSVDTAAVMALLEERDRRLAAGQPVEIAPGPARERLLALIDETVPLAPDPAPRRRTLADDLERIGRGTAGFVVTGAELLGYLGLFLDRLARAIVQPRRFRLTAFVAQADAAGLQAVPIVLLISFLIGVVIGFQGALQLRQFGAEIFAVDLIAISVLRELAVLLTSIIVAGRTASAYTATIGSMKMNEEIDAMRTLGIDPVEALIVPRILALIVTLPILVLLADIAGLIGGAAMSWATLNISPSMFATRLIEGVDWIHAVVGLVKAPVFALLIGLIGCHAGMRVKGDAASLGMMTSRAVVAAIFAVIVADAGFSIVFAEVGL